MKRVLLVALAVLPLVGCDQIAIRKAEAAVRGDLIDPESAMFTDVKVEKHGHVCGYVNARNRLGGMAGKERFMVEYGHATLESEFEGERAAPGLDRQNIEAQCRFDLRWSGCQEGDAINRYLDGADGCKVVQP